MNNRKFDIPFALGTFAGSFVLNLVFVLALPKRSLTGVPAALAVGAAFLLPAFASLAAIYVISRIRVRVRVKLPTTVLPAVLLLALCFAVGFLGQLAYGIRVQKKQEILIPSDSDYMLMLDDSGSLIDYRGNIHAASVQFVDALSEESRLGAGLFAAKDGGQEKLTKMDAAGKTALKDFLDISNSFAGGTDLNTALETAYKSLSGASGQRRRAVIVITDDQGKFENAVKENYIKSGVSLYTIRISDNAAETDPVAVFASESGGFDTVISKADAARNDLGAFSDAFSSITGVTTAVTTSGSGLLIYDEGVVWYRVLIRLAFFAILAVLIQFVYFRRSTLAGALISAAVGLAVGGAVTFLGSRSLPVLSALIPAIGIYTAFISLNISQEVNPDV